MKDNLNDATKRANAIAAVVGMYFAGQEPGVIGSALADLMSTFLLNHKIPDDLARQERLREEILTTWCDTVRQLVAVQDKEGARLQ